MAYDDGFYYGQCKIICESESVDDKVVALVGNGKNYSDRLVNKKAEFLVPGRTEYTVSMLDGNATLWSGTVNAGYGECIHVMLADGYDPVIEKDFQPIKNNLTASNGVNFKFGIDANGRYGYIKDGADSVTPFRMGYAYDISDGMTFGQTVTMINGYWNQEIWNKRYAQINNVGLTDNTWKVDVKAWLKNHNLDSVIDYTKLTPENFVLNLVGIQAGANTRTTEGGTRPTYPSSPKTVTKGYSDGVLTFDVGYASEYAFHDYADWKWAGGQGIATVQVKPWLVINY